MTSFLAYKKPAVSFNYFYDFFYLHNPLLIPISKVKGDNCAHKRINTQKTQFFNGYFNDRAEVMAITDCKKR